MRETIDFLGLLEVSHTLQTNHMLRLLSLLSSVGACEDAAFVRRVFIGMSYKTIPDVDDGFGDRTSACREYTLPREDPKFQDLCNNSRTNYKWTSSSSSYYTIS